MAFQMLAALLLGAWAGTKADTYFATSPIFTVVLILLGLAAAMYIVIKTVLHDN